MEVKSIQPSFGMALKSKDVKAVDNFMFEHLNANSSNIYRGLVQSNEECNEDIFLSVITNRFGIKNLKAEVGSKTFISGFITSPIRTIKEATKYAHKLQEAKK
ncbi:hypothetical protein J6P92_09610 [bacterium]|nr:hypothetical protein [bacterium]